MCEEQFGELVTSSIQCRKNIGLKISDLQEHFPAFIDDLLEKKSLFSWIKMFLKDDSFQIAINTPKSHDINPFENV